MRMNCMQQSYGQPRSNSSPVAAGFWGNLVKFDGGTLNIFLANQQIYLEACAIFYSSNKFDFARVKKQGVYHPESLVNALHFLLDRPKHALIHIKSLRFSLGEYWTDRSPKDDWPSGGYLRALCEVLGNEYCLSELDIGVFGAVRTLHPCLEHLCN